MERKEYRARKKTTDENRWIKTLKRKDYFKRQKMLMKRKGKKRKFSHN